MALEPRLRIPPPAPAAPQGPDFAAMTGPFGWRRLHPDVRRRFATDHAKAVTYPGRLDVSRNLAGLCFALAAKAMGGPLPIAQARGAAAIVCVRNNGKGGVIWERWLELKAGKAPLRIASTKQTGDDGCLLECVDGGLGMRLRVFERDHGLVFESMSYFATLAGRRIPLPHWLTPGVCRVAHHHVTEGQFRFTMTVEHPWFGRTFHQTGIFHDGQDP
jgi:Domain of unknown function (DUF4166)